MVWYRPIQTLTRWALTGHSQLVITPSLVGNHLSNGSSGANIPQKQNPFGLLSQAHYTANVCRHSDGIVFDGQFVNRDFQSRF